MTRMASEHLKAVAIAEVDALAERLARIAPHIQGQDPETRRGNSLKSLLLTIAEEIRERYE